LPAARNAEPTPRHCERPTHPNAVGIALLDAIQPLRVIIVKIPNILKAK